MVTYEAAERIGRQNTAKNSFEYSPTNVGDDTPSVFSFLVDLAKIGVLFGLGRSLSALLSCG